MPRNRTGRVAAPRTHRHAPRVSGTRRFGTFLFTDIVGSTMIAREMGDLRWQALIARHHAIVRRELKRFDGHELDTAGDGFFAILDSPGAAIRCAVALTEAVREVGLEIRAGLHSGEVETTDGKPGGIAVNTAARVMAVAGHGHVSDLGEHSNRRWRNDAPHRENLRRPLRLSP